MIKPQQKYEHTYDSICTRSDKKTHVIYKLQPENFRKHKLMVNIDIKSIYGHWQEQPLLAGTLYNGCISSAVNLLPFLKTCVSCSANTQWVKSTETKMTAV